ncbi:hypothetical protein LTR48_000357 [Friedmanniomyces endolithicus]|uniref:N-acetyltransferase domain-containing protein n=1 Tax=Rachicladosporium monterosium TaxID=1507873 RepID=A0ABR0LGT0_9PEZI|nr:hypothetical protein LTR48_000357 [Friedmanniomyces endolithicus]KAK5148554.1 hypothetical protein LTR32_000151 [Rachicladosporium monterosium]
MDNEESMEVSTSSRRRRPYSNCFFRTANADEYELLARILMNAFLLNWDVNWWQDLSSPLNPVKTEDFDAEELTSAQKTRLNFYRGVLNFVSLIGGTTSVAVPLGSERAVAVICWLPPNIRPSLWSLTTSRFLWNCLGFGPFGLYHFWYFEETCKSIWRHLEAQIAYRQAEGAYVQILATDPIHAGEGYSEALLRWQVEQHQRGLPNAPIFLETVADYSQRVYERVGFKELARQVVRTTANEDGLRTTKRIDIEERRRIDEGHIMRLMMIDVQGRTSIQ